MKYFVYPFIFIAMCANSALANTDWTPVFKSMQKNCDYNAVELSNSLRSIPKKYKGSVISNSLNNNNGFLTRTINLKNAKAFGYPLKKVEIGYPKEGSGDHISLYFTDRNFLRLKSVFYYDVNGIKVYADKPQSIFIPGQNEYEEAYLNIESKGYTLEHITGSVGLVFNTQNNSLTCFIDI